MYQIGWKVTKLQFEEKVPKSDKLLPRIHIDPTLKFGNDNW